MGGGTYTGIEAVSNGLQILREPRVQTGKRTMLYMAISLSFTAGGILLCYLLNNVAIRNLIRGSAAPAAVLTRGELDTVFSLYGLPTIETYDVKVRAEQADGTYVDVRPMAENKAFLLPPGSVGETLWGPTAESRNLIGTPLQSQAPGIYASTYGKDEPPSEWIKAVAVAFPSLPNVHLLGQITVAA